MSGSRQSNQESWWEYLEAARRKIKIARYHLARLGAEEAALARRPEGVSIPAQASFEGVLYGNCSAGIRNRHVG